MMTDRQMYMAKEQMVSDWLDDRLWMPLAAHQDQRIARIYDTQRQVQGMDYIMGDMVIDCKCRMDGHTQRYYDQAALEMGGYDSLGRWRDGWMVDPMMHTTHYAYITPHHKDGHYIGYTPTSETLGSCDVVICSKADIWAYLLADTSLADIMADVASLRDMDNTADPIPQIHRPYHDWYITQSRAIRGMPINLIMSMSTLETLPSTHIYHVTDDGYTQEIDCPF